MQVGIYPAQGPKTRLCHDDEDSCKCKPKPKPDRSECTGTGRTQDSTDTTPSLLPPLLVVVVRRPQPQYTQKCDKDARCCSWPIVTLVGIFDDDGEVDDDGQNKRSLSPDNKFSSVALPLLSSKSYSGLPSAWRACPNGTTRRLLVLFKGDGSCPPDPGPDPPLLGSTIRVGLMSSRHLRKQLLKSLGIPSSTTVETGTKGRSSMPAARMAYS